MKPPLPSSALNGFLRTSAEPTRAASLPNPCAVCRLDSFGRFRERRYRISMRIGLFGGTFDPIHWGHLRSAEEVREAFDLDRVYFHSCFDSTAQERTNPDSSARSARDGPLGRGQKSPLHGFDRRDCKTGRFVLDRHDSSFRGKSMQGCRRSILLSAWMHLPRSAPGRISRRFFLSVISL